MIKNDSNPKEMKSLSQKHSCTAMCEQRKEDIFPLFTLARVDLEGIMLSE